jgi:hypothetical protein
MVTRDLITRIAQSRHLAEAGHPSPLDGIYVARKALIDWFDNWLSVPVSSYYCQTTATLVQIVYGVSRLGRWARLVSFKVPQFGRAEDEEHELNEALDPTLANPSGPHSMGPLPNRTPSTVASATSAAPTAGGSDMSNESRRPLCPVASVQGQLGLFPGLEIDVSEILSLLQKRFQDVSRWIQMISISEEQRDLNAWSMTAIKIFLTRHKLENWAEAVAEGVEALSLSDRPRLAGGTGSMHLLPTAVSEDVGMNTSPEGDDSIMTDYSFSRSLLMHELCSDNMGMGTMPAHFYVSPGAGEECWTANMPDGSTWYDGYTNGGGL